MEGATATSARPLDAAEFEALMAPFRPFESSPCLAVAVSGGADSMALAWLAHEWARNQGGHIVALTVDHRLRPESAREAADVGRALSSRAITHEILTRDDGFDGNVEHAARRARYRLLEDWCSDRGVLNLLTAHHRDDQAETVLMRLTRGSGLDGLAGMAAESYRRDVRLLRPLLGVAQARLKATALAAGLPVVEDPMNQDLAYQRARLRSMRDVLAAEGLTAERLAATAAHLARARAALDTLVAETLARSVRFDPIGFATVDATVLRAAPEEAGLRALAAVLTTVGGADYPPRFERLARLYAELPDGLGGGRTLGGCLVLPEGGNILICREPAAVAPAVTLTPGMMVHWDGRFRVVLPADAPSGFSVAALGMEAGFRLAKDGFGSRIPAAIRAGLPALYDTAGLAAVPALCWRRDVNVWRGGPEIAIFAPLRPLSGSGFTVV